MEVVTLGISKIIATHMAHSKPLILRVVETKAHIRPLVVTDTDTALREDTLNLFGIETTRTIDQLTVQLTTPPEYLAPFRHGKMSTAKKLNAMAEDERMPHSLLH